MKWIAAAVIIVLSCAGLSTHAQTCPAKTVRIIVPASPGGTTDTTARLLAKKYTEALGQTFVVDSRGGAGGMIGTEAALRAPADGYTIFFSSSSLSVNATLFGAKLKFDPTRDFAPVIWPASSRWRCIDRQPAWRCNRSATKVVDRRRSLCSAEESTSCSRR